MNFKLLFEKGDFSVKTKKIFWDCNSKCMKKHIDFVFSGDKEYDYNVDV